MCGTLEHLPLPLVPRKTSVQSGPSWLANMFHDAGQLSAPSCHPVSCLLSASVYFPFKHLMLSEKIKVNRLKVNMLHLFHLLLLVNLGQQKSIWLTTSLLMSSVKEIMRGAQELYIKMSGSNLVKSLQHLLSGNYHETSLLFPLYKAWYWARNTPNHKFYFQFKAYLGWWGGRKYQKLANGEQSLEDEAERHPDFLGSLLRLGGFIRLPGTSYIFSLV